MDPVTLDALIRPTGLTQSPLGVVIFDTELRIVWPNEAAEHLSDGIPATAWPGRRIGEVLPQMDTGLIEQSLRRVLATGEPVAGLEVSNHADGDPGNERFWGCVQYRIDGPDGEAAGVAHVMREVTGRAHSQRRPALAEEASARIGTTLDITRTAEELLAVAIPRLADAGAVDLLTTVIKGDQHAPHAHHQKMRLRRVALRWPADPPAAREYARHTWLETNPAKLLHQRLVAGSPVYLPALGAMTTGQIREMDAGTAFNHMMAAHRAGARSLMILPLVARGVIMGLAGLYRLAGSEPFTPADLSLARGFVSRAAVPLDNARLYTRERATALTLQRGLLPRQIPDIPGLQLAYSARLHRPDPAPAARPPPPRPALAGLAKTPRRNRPPMPLPATSQVRTGNTTRSPGKEQPMRYVTPRPKRLGRWAAAALTLLAALAAAVVTTGGHASASAGANGDPTTSALIHRLDSVPARQRPTIVLVHGAWADSSSWRGEINTLQAAGFPVRAVGNPLENLTTDAEFVAGFLKTIPGPIVLVGHSYGGAVITNAATGNRNVKALVYVDAAAPAPGETNGQLSGSDSILAKDTPAELFQDTTIPGAPAGVHELYLKEDIFVRNFANDLPRSEAQELWASQRGASQAAFDTPSKTAAWKTIPSWYFISTGDQIITPTSELAMAKRAHSHITLFHGGSHLTLISHPNAVTAVIASAICSLR